MKNEQKKSPFFARFLENQGKIRGGTGITKPSLDVAQTMKYPSDGDEELLDW